MCNKQLTLFFSPTSGTLSILDWGSFPFQNRERLIYNEEMSNFWPKPFNNPFGKKPFFDLFESMLL